jgi:hypothetical protein
MPNSQKKNMRYELLLQYLLQSSNSIDRLPIIIRRMCHEHLMRFLSFVHVSFFSHQNEFLHENRSCFQMILIACDISTITSFLRSIEFEHQITIIYENQTLWIHYLVGLFQQNDIASISVLPNQLAEQVGDIFVLDLLSMIARQIENDIWAVEVRLNIFMWIVQNPRILSHVVRTIYELQQHEITPLQNAREWVQRMIEQNGFNIQIQIDNLEPMDDGPPPNLV